jgi:hypothetical protein
MAQTQQGMGTVPMQNLAEIGAHTIVQGLQALQFCAAGIAALCAEQKVSPQGFQGFGGLQAGGGMPGYNPLWGQPSWAQTTPIANTQLNAGASGGQAEQGTGTGTGTGAGRGQQRKTSTAKSARTRTQSTAKQSNTKTARGGQSEGKDPKRVAAGKLGAQRRSEQQPQTGMHAAE